jgi:hypothetical protein
MAHHLGAHTQGTKNIAAVGTGDIIATPGASARLHVCRGTVSINTVAGSAIVSLDDGTTTIWAVAASDVSQAISHQIDFGDEGYELSKNKALKLTVAGGNADAYATFTGYVR